MVTRPNPHDAFFRQAFGSPKHVVGLLKLVLPKHLQAVLDLNPDKIRVLDPTHVDAELRGTLSDLIVEVPRLAAAGEAARAPKTPTQSARPCSRSCRARPVRTPTRSSTTGRLACGRSTTNPPAGRPWSPRCATLRR